MLAELQANEKNRDIPTIIVSADATTGQIKRLMETGAREYMTKPIDVELFYHLLDETGQGSKEPVVAKRQLFPARARPDPDYGVWNKSLPD